uniref:Integrase catalytic domain-containing protein n=1 Tax=Fagus sylvatica TaxID=28930 RepID=A0A2N9FJA4_FAGSY
MDSSASSSSVQSALSLINNMSHLMSIKLDSTNYMIWKLQISAILDAYSMIEHLDGTIAQPRQFLISEAGVQSVNSEFLAWKKRDKALLTLIYSTLSPPVLAMVVGKGTSQEVWETLEERFTCTARANVLNLKLELQAIRKGNESVSSYLQRIKTTRDMLYAVGVQIDNEELLHIILKGLPKEYAPFASAIRTRDGILSLEKLSVLLQTEEQSMKEGSDPLMNSALAMFVSNTNKPNTGFNGHPSYGNPSYNRGRGRNSFQRGRGGRSHNFTPSQPPYQQQNQNQAPYQQQNQNQASPQARSERPICQICWKQGHYAIDCYHRMDFAYQGKNPTMKLAAMASASNTQHTQSAESWLTDSGASDHITANANNLSPQVPYQGQEQVSVGNGQNLPIQNIGNSQLHTKYHKFQLKNVLHVPRIASNLLSVHKLCLHNNCSCYFDANQLLVQDLPTGRLLYKGLSKNGVYPIQSQLFNSANKTACTAQSSSDKWQLWHSRLGHPSAKVLSSLSHSFNFNFLSKPVLEHCHHCLAGKMHQLPFPSSNKQVQSPFELVHSDLWGPAPVVSTNAFRYYLVFVDEFTKFTWVYLLKHKSDTFHTFTQFQAMVHTQFSLPIKTIRTDCGGEFTSNQFNQFCASKGMIHQVSCPHTPQQNGVAERKHRHLVQCALALLSQSTLPMSYWSYAISTAAHLINKLPTPNLSNKSPWETLYHTLPDFTYLKTFGCQCFPLLTPYTAHKLYPKTAPCIFLGYPTHSKGYYCLDPTTLRLYVSRHVLFNESTFPGLKHSTDQHTASTSVCRKLVTQPSPTALIPQPSSTSTVQNPLASTSHSPLPPVNTNDPTIPTSAPITNPTPPLQHHMQTRSKHGIFKPKVSYAAHIDYTTTEPTSYTNASKHSQWCTAMDEEFQALQKQGTWSLVPLPATKNVVGCKWVYKLKHNSDGSIARYKARLVAKGFHQQQGIDFDETFSPVIKPPTVRLILSLAVSLQWPLRQLDVKNAFLHGTLKEEVYMTQPQGYIDPTHPNLVSSTADSSLFIYKNESVIAYLLLYVDDIVLTSNTPTYLDHLITQLNTKHNMLDCKPASSPSCPNTRLSLHDGDPLTDPHGYRSMVGALHYLTFTRPDISFAVHQVCQYMSAPTTTHLAAAKRVLRYIRGTLHHGIEFTPGPLSLSAYTDADWAGDPDDRRSTSGFLIYLGSNAITWSAKKQPTVSRSSTESEYRALAFASAELCWIRTLLKDLGIFISDTPILWCDNVSALAIASNPVFHARTKHIEVDFHFVRERVLRKDLLVKFVSTVDQLADIFTKSLPTNRFLDLRHNLIVPVPEIEGG